MKNETFGCKKRGDKIGVLLAQLGTPDAPTKQALRPYLKQFLSDPRVIEKNRVLWWLILNGIVLRTRPARSAALYKRIWTEQGSPLMIYTERQTEAVAEALRSVHSTIEVAFGMRYGNPSVENAIDDLIERGCSKILLFSMYPQYSATTTASNYDAVFRHLLKRRTVPTLRVAEPYYAHAEYVESLAHIVNETYAEYDKKPECIVLSYHGIPEAYIDKGDPYCCHCAETTQALLPLLKVDGIDVIHTYQSRFGRDPWLVPYTDETIVALAKEGKKNIAVFCPGFVADCLETLDEIGNEAEEEFRQHGGEVLQLIPCLNDDPVWCENLSALIEKELGSWLETARRTAAADCSIACPVQREKGQLLKRAREEKKTAMNA